MFSELAKKQCHPFIVDGMLVGLIRPDIYKHLLDYKDVFTFHAAPSSVVPYPYDDYRVGSVELGPQYKTYEERTSVVDRVLRELKEKRCLVALKGWREEVNRVKATAIDCRRLTLTADKITKYHCSATRSRQTQSRL